VKSVFFLLLAACLAVGAWTLLEGPVDVAREPARMGLQIEPARFHVLGEADLARMRAQAEHAAATVAATGAPPVAAPPAAAPAAAVELPSASCVEIGVFAAEAAARKARTRLAALGIGEHLSMTTTDHATRLHITGVDSALEARIHEVLKDFPKQELAHCVEPPAVHAEH